MDPRHIQAMLSLVSNMMLEQHRPVAEDGVAVASWSAVDDAAKQIEASTIQVTSLKTGAIIGDDGDTGLAKARVDVGTIGVGLQYAPRGGERTIMHATESTPVASFIHGSNDTDPTLKPGEWTWRHFQASASFDGTAAPAVDAYIALRNDGVSAGDGKGSLLMLAAALFKVATTSGAGFLVDDATGTVQIQGSGTASGDAVVRQSDLQAAVNAVIMHVNTAIATLAAEVQGGSGVSAPTVASVMATGSTKTFTA